MSRRGSWKNKEDLQRVCSQATSIKEALELLGLRPAGGNYKAFRDACVKFGVSPPNFDFAGQAKRLASGNRTPLEDILVERSTYSRSHLKKRLIDAGLLAYECEECGLGGEWNGKSLSLQLDHRNGVHNDNRIENLRFLCPNCHSQTPTFAGKKSKNTSNRYTVSRPTKIDWPDTDDLIELVKSTSYSHVSRILGVSDNAIRKRIRTRSK